MIDKSALGAVGKAFDIDIDRGKIYEFARAVLSEDPAYIDDERPVIPPTFLTTMFFWQNWEEGANPWDLVQMSQERGMHAEQEFVFHGEPPRAGDRLVGQSRIAEIYEKQSRGGSTLTFVKMITEFRDKVDGRLVAEAILTGVER